MRQEFVLIKEKVIALKDAVPLPRSGVSYKGAIEYDKETDSLRCHECGQWMKDLRYHVLAAHDLPAKEYKRKHGLNTKTALINQASLLAMKINAANLNMRRKEHPKIDKVIRQKALAKSMKFRPLEAKPNLCEQRNLYLKDRQRAIKEVRKLAEKLNRTPTLQEIHAEAVPWQKLFKYGLRSYEQVLKLAGLKPEKKIA